MKVEPIIGEEQRFPLFDKELVVSKEMDEFNSYRKTFKDLANKLLEEVKVAYKANIHDFDSFVEYFMEIYNSKLEVLVKRAIDMLIVEGVYSVSYDDFLRQHKEDFHLAIDDYNTMINNFNLTLEANQEHKSNMMSYVPNMIGGGFGLGGAIKGMATAMAFNAIRDNVEVSMIKNAQVSAAQRAELYNRLNIDILFNNVFLDFWRVFLSLVFTLNQNGKNIWWPSNDADTKTRNIFSNIANPNFPQDKVLDVIIDCLQTHPYNVDYYSFLTQKYKENKELKAIKKYFDF